jgi:hypothetical protein
MITDGQVILLGYAHIRRVLTMIHMLAKSLSIVELNVASVGCCHLRVRTRTDRFSYCQD